jgi:predicted nucleic acid-binding protein
MYILDTDHVSLLERVDNVDKQRLKNRLNRLAEGELATTIIAFEEQIDAVLLSRNLVDFRRVPNLRVEDWIS